MKKFAERLKFIRKEAGLTQKQVADNLSIIESSYQRYEQARVLPGYEMLKNIADCLDVSLDYLMCQTDNPLKRPKS